MSYCYIFSEVLFKGSHFSSLELFTSFGRVIVSLSFTSTSPGCFDSLCHSLLLWPVECRAALFLIVSSMEMEDGGWRMKPADGALLDGGRLQAASRPTSDPLDPSSSPRSPSLHLAGPAGPAFQLAARTRTRTLVHGLRSTVYYTTSTGCLQATSSTSTRPAMGTNTNANRVALFRPIQLKQQSNKGSLSKQTKCTSHSTIGTNHWNERTAWFLFTLTAGHSIHYC